MPLTPRVFAVLCELARTPRVLVTKNTLLDAVWGHRFVSDSALKSAISTLRAALGGRRETTALYRDRITPRIPLCRCRQHTFCVAPPPARATGPLSAEENAPPLIGRASELERLHNAWRRAAAGERQIVLIAGEAGVGKTTLIERFVSEVGGLHCAHGQCVDQHGAGEPYLAVLEALTALCRRDTSLADLIRTVAPTWLHQLPWLSSAAERASIATRALRRDPGSDVARSGRTARSVHGKRPLLLVTEDLHWSDRATVQLINYIARRRTGTRLLWLASFRPVELIAADHPLQDRPPGVASSRPSRRDLPRFFLGARGFRISCPAQPRSRSGRNVSASIARSHRRVASVRRGLRERFRRARKFRHCGSIACLLAVGFDVDSRDVECNRRTSHRPVGTRSTRRSGSGFRMRPRVPDFDGCRRAGYRCDRRGRTVRAACT